MKTLYLVRHAKSSQDDPGLQDHERPLLPKGIKKTEKIIEFLERRNFKPDIIVSSHAVRAHETAALIARGLGYPEEEIIIESNLYLNGADGIMKIAFSFPDEKDSAMLVGHNPCMTEFANYFLMSKIDSMPTSGVVSVSFKTDEWNRVPMAEKKVNFVVFPNDL